MKLDSTGINLIKGFEGLELLAYKDVAGVWTIGYGSTHYKNGVAVKKGDALLNEACASDLMILTLSPYEFSVNHFVTVPLTQNQYNALVSFSYNEGANALPGSHLLAKLNAKDYQGAADEFLKWVYITDAVTHEHKICNDLVKRRGKERALFLKP